MNYHYEEDYRFSELRGVTGWLGFFLARICLGVIAGVLMMLKLIPVLALYADRLNMILAGTVILSVLVLCIGIAEIILFSQRNKLFVWLYLVMAAINILSAFLTNTVMQGCLFVAVESAFVAYLLTSKNVAVRFSFYNKVNRVALDAYAAKRQVNAEEERILDEIEELTEMHRRNRIGLEEYLHQKRALLRQL